MMKHIITITFFLYFFNTSYGQFSGGSGGGADIGGLSSPETFDLPVELTAFTLTANENGTVDLSWETATEINNKHFEIEKSKDAKHWLVIHTEQGAGNSNVSIKYSFTDQNTTVGTSYYRLRQVDFDGQYSYSNVLLYQNGESSTSPLYTYPNPFQDHFVITGDEVEIETLRLFNTSGKEISFQKNGSIDNMKEIDLSGHPKGIYYYKTRNLSGRIIKR
ncbi:T9SS type A sorting domain-containing protein [Flammeovirga agarivorans]|uniref:T9SS type A sorting domain-containing protein n=1 Tax=Flammeovirga agarivorans TaxID=2726742 RepID=A0A7X8XVZ9_9BACT|nr:T9SS type A sorting domain-containing protein [Flammeovirga agarivorans]NLR91771.1 T9SS type A sorting domain-containing protein [Flammeovirga agarivorans]